MTNIGQFESSLRQYTLQNDEVLNGQLTQSFEGLDPCEDAHCELLQAWAKETLPISQFEIIDDHISIVLNKEKLYNWNTQSASGKHVQAAMLYIDKDTLHNFLTKEYAFMSEDDFYEAYGLSHPDNLE